MFSADQFALILSALKTQNQTKLVSNPTVVTLNNTEAQIHVGAEYPIPNYTYKAERGTFEVSGFEYRPVGIILKVTPQVNAQGCIKLTIEPEVSSQNGFTSFGGAGGAEIPIIATRKAKTQVSLRDGFTMGIGGLIESNASDGETRVPLLGSIPGLGRLFRSSSKTEDVRNLLIFITAKTVSADGAEIGAVFDPRSVRRMNLREDEFPGFRDGSDPFAPPLATDTQP
ncbi:MAG: type II and III secretion system protein [Candidatus Synoicihabitans palmerolidicus]|nr:type II and III secretion system protein [Candidatus Synoicihabitans palmerolidicus]